MIFKEPVIELVTISEDVIASSTEGGGGSSYCQGNTSNVCTEVFCTDDESCTDLL